MKIVIGLPAYNEEKNIASIITQLKEVSTQIIVCNDGSSDQTGAIAEAMGVIVVNHAKNIGYGAAIKSLFTKFMDLDADILVTFDADGQHRIEDIKIVTEPLIKDEADVVIGSRFLDADDQDMPAYRKIGIKTITNLTNVSTDIKLTDSQSGFRAYARKVLSDIMPSEHGMGVSTEILIKASKKGFRIKEVPIKILYQGDTSTHHPVSHGVSVILSTMKFVSIEHPLKFYGVPGLCFLVIGLFFVVWTIQYFTEFGVFPPVLALIAIGSTLFGLMFLMTAVMLYSLVNVVREKNS
ncbi:glycosyltransferase family 2 protein [Candidatus Nitrosotenuis chungbukensis]|uniref:glycosyltransferase family 2 protein n=1 Tax=Candidatus Nitrosotenuis chungbukensis TaxID=1353246 RepID=UPI0005B2866B|nr:glycosyltransferase family 2 protein [Candidatus Nitrosotenuis chungbukensis]WKT58324.1 glycosyltransferase family 2 protein [Candidatus Nitrosotenuis chungbukensis]